MIKELDIRNCGKLKKYIDHFPTTKVMVIGDIIMDEFIWGDVSRISPEAPVPVVDVKRETKMLGGAANVINNIRALDGQSTLCGLVGDDLPGREIREYISNLGSDTDGIIHEDNRPTSIKTRIIAYNQQVVRFDREVRKDIQPETIEKLLSYIKENKEDLDAIVVADYGKGVISGKLMEGLRELVLHSGIILAVDPKTDNFEYYKGMDIITPNHHEAGAFCHFEINDEDTLIKAGNYMLDKLNCRSVLITQGKDGMTLFENNGDVSHIPSVGRKVFDVTGAGDTVISSISLGLAAGMDIKSAAIISNFAAGIVVGEVGTSTVRAEELKRAINGSR